MEDSSISNGIIETYLRIRNNIRYTILGILFHDFINRELILEYIRQVFGAFNQSERWSKSLRLKLLLRRSSYQRLGRSPC